MPSAKTANQKQQTARATAPFSFYEFSRNPESAPIRVHLTARPAHRPAVLS
jgi:hypothetical protein